jgi:hypothetical protein
MTKLQSDYYTYAYLREDKTPYYIGKGRGKRIYSKNKLINPPKDRSRIIFLKKDLTEAEAFKHEIYMIFVFGRKDLGTGILRNLTNGGDGASGRVNSEKTKKKLSAVNSGKNNPMYGRTGEKNPNYNVPQTEEHKRKNSMANSGENNSNYGNTGALSSRSKAVIAIQPDGTELRFGGVREAARELGIKHSNLGQYLKTDHSPTRGKFKGWKFIYQN